MTISFRRKLNTHLQNPEDNSQLLLTNFYKILMSQNEHNEIPHVIYKILRIFQDFKIIFGVKLNFVRKY